VHDTTDYSLVYNLLQKVCRIQLTVFIRIKLIALEMLRHMTSLVDTKIHNLKKTKHRTDQFWAQQQNTVYNTCNSSEPYLTKHRTDQFWTQQQNTVYNPCNSSEPYLTKHRTDQFWTQQQKTVYSTCNSSEPYLTKNSTDQFWPNNKTQFKHSLQYLQ